MYIYDRQLQKDYYGFYRDTIGIMEENMETTILDYVGLYRVYIGVI